RPSQLAFPPGSAFATVEPGVRLCCSRHTDLPENQNNIAVRAAQLFLRETDNSRQGVNILLRKNIPVAAGLGGGSSDAAAVVNGLDQLLQTRCPVEKRAAMAVQIGADVPFFIYAFPAALAEGIGERLVSAPPLADFQVVLVNPGIPVSTKQAFADFSSTAGKIALTAEQKAFNLPCSENNRQEMYPEHIRKFSVPDDLHNDLEPVTAERYSVIRDIKNRLLAYGAAGAMMSGSGSTVFGLFHQKTEAKAEHCRKLLRQEYNQVYLVSPLLS
ncbi:MAG: 4-(cytidine 5'-diphospho)-2-C-methyl-D-erythritol kinase, partial [Candidatus Electrothrix sp. EH2]|nr:4-(cytidine 5'-diphospho)-2-C-methyl-D-erythritol kinase [Candidatus Electrothrix sp. EH2]